MYLFNLLIVVDCIFSIILSWKKKIKKTKIFCTFTSSINLALNAVLVAVFMKSFYFYLLKTDTFWGSNVFIKKEKLKGKFSDSLE